MVQKRDGRCVTFDATKIFHAIRKAGSATSEFDERIAQQLMDTVLSALKQSAHQNALEVEHIQDLVEEVLLNTTYKKTAKAYILYRDQHANLRKLVNQSKVNLIDNYLLDMDWQVKENSNMGFSLQGLNNYISNEASKTYWLNKIYPPHIRDAHLSGDFHIHDLSALSVYCVGWDLQDLLRVGFTGVSGKVASAPAKHFRAALGQIVNFFYTLQGEAAGAQAFSSFDTLLAPFIRYDRLQYKDVKQALQEFVFNVNVPTRVGFQSPFTNVTLDLKVPKHLATQPVVIGGEPQENVYGNFQTEMDVFNQAFLEVLSEGDANGRIFTFPIPTYNITKDFSWDNPNLTKLWEVTAKYGIPYFANFVNSDMSPDDARSMCCRLRIDNRALSKRGGGLFGANPLTGSIGVVTINMPRLAYLAKDEKDFFVRLKQLMDLAKESLEIKRKTLEKLTDGGLYPYTKFYLRDIKERHHQYWFNHFSTIGLLGMHEACLHLIHEGIGKPLGHAFAVKTMDFMRDTLMQYQEETGHHYNLEATPAEATSYRLAKLDREKFPTLQQSLGLNQDDFIYTNSTQLPVHFTDDVFKMLDLQDGLQSKYTGGTVAHVFLGEAVANPEAVKQFIRKICTTYQMPYFSITPTFSICPTHGYLSGRQECCATCGEETEVYSRVVGYFRPVKQWNVGKQAEFKQRALYSVEKTS
ncbi:MAG: ribonucleoside triphosphate reductase [Gammaproteobacteria bacterium]|nr:ribonucleoside triphosphate reductase [Gammaproteobacteria bacterium]MBU2546702.1 ribonucleoside triphosphate reductase [Gammaproteobacteria bacterium]